jgi:UDP-glucose 4-epimerase
VPDDTAVGLLGPGGEPWTLHVVDVRDAADGVVRALTEPAGGEGHAFHIAGPEPTAHDEGAAIVAEAYGVPTLLVEMPKRWRLEMAADAARELLGFVPKHDYRGTVADGLAAGLAGQDAYIPARV